ncbi:MAG: sulfotransferase [Proteobacteria bacterium]|nr:sulfotransferase [Pseudomonadota bacterium]
MLTARERMLANAGDVEALIEKVSKLRKISLGEKVSTFFKMSLLSRPVTHEINMMSNTGMAILESAKDAPATAFDRLLIATFKMGGHDLGITKAFNVGDIAAASKKGAQRGMRDARAALKGLGPDSSVHTDYLKEIHFDTPWLEAWRKVTFNTLKAEDAFFKGLAIERSVREQARVLGKRAKVTGDALNEFIEKIVASPADDIMLRAITDAEIATFTNKGVLASAGIGLKRGIRTGVDRLATKGDALGDAAEALATGSELLFPFVSTPANVATRIAEFSPLGALSSMGGVFKLARRVKAAKGLTGKETERVRRVVHHLLDEFTYDLAELGRYYRLYARLMDHWRAVLPGRFLDLSYEDLVARPEPRMRELLDFCELEWDETCLDFHKIRRPVSTASAHQVHQPIYRTAVERWRRYEGHLGALRDALGPLADDG